MGYWVWLGFYGGAGRCLEEHPIVARRALGLRAQREVDCDRAVVGRRGGSCAAEEIDQRWSARAVEETRPGAGLAAARARSWHESDTIFGTCRL